MAHILLSYGQQSLDFDYDEARLRLLAAADAGAAAAVAALESPLTDAQILHHFDHPFDSPSLDDIISPGESVLIVVPDATRRAGSGQIVNLLVRRLVQAGISPADIRIIFATGLHRPVSAEERRALLTDFIVQRIRIFDHNPNDDSALVDLGTTEQGTPILLNRMLTQHSHIITIGAVGFHYFAGFTGGRKSICPGLSGVKTIEATHKLAFDFSTGGRRSGVGAGRLDGNLVHEEMERIAAEVAPSFALNSVADAYDRVVNLCAGDWRIAHRRLCAEYAEAHTIKIPEKLSLVVASCGGAPSDINLIQAHKTLDAAAHACTDGGTIVLLAKCQDGFGRADFLKWFDAPNPRALVTRLNENYEVNGQTAWALLVKAERFRVVLVSSLQEEDVRRMYMTPAKTLEQAMQLVGDARDGYIMPHGAAYLPVVRAEG